ncbi:hypothetical protein [Mucilaginibacter jinjuensis]|uniref:YD repeat-containing protein n=1 Tax=Mucilaginibacter jinjuensis TaxID=1176721 RepID=A0ABY7TES3_9SPHI|nr:hypothetical protein [Mucilaginibacter jinjuensis]WCT13672.1 hypothetical protein PQO05_06950 [Mucilaginibacter jinjuensis]
MNTLKAQTILETTPPKLAPNSISPEATAFGKFGDIPVGLYTGVPNITVPIYTIKAKGIEIPISLNYHSSGNKVNDIATTVGLGWSLQAGGGITCAVNGLPDIFGWLGPQDRTPQTGTLPASFDAFTWNRDPQYMFMYGAATDSIDTKPDLFYLNMPGKNIKFFFDQDRNIYTIPYQRIKMTYATGGNAFTVTDEHDNYFEFNKEEDAITESVGTGGSLFRPFYPTPSWYLTRIITAHHDTISFLYDSLKYNFDNQPTEIRYGKAVADNACDPGFSRLQTSTTTITAWRIREIIASTGDHVVFNYNLNRTDLPNTQALTQIALYYKNQDSPLKTFDLNYDYFSSGTRLKLTGVKESGAAPYSFEYGGPTLPARFSPSQDHWGYFNNKTNSTLLPMDDTHGFFTGANREPDTAAMKAGILKKIIYPTGGYSSFDYDANDYVTTERTGTTQGFAQLTGLANQTVNQSFMVTANSSYFTLSYDSGNPVKTPGGGIPPTGDSEAQITLTGPSNFSAIYHGKSVNGGLTIPDLAPGNYNIEIVCNGDFGSPFLTVQWTHPADPSTTATFNKFAGGLRIKSITNYSGPASNTLVTKYFEYKNTNGLSSGVLGYKPQYMNYMVHKDVNKGNYFQECYYTSQSSNSLAPLSTIQGGNVAYTRVKVYTRDSIGMGYTVNVLSQGDVSGVLGYPYSPIVSYDWLEGLPLETTDYIYNNVTGKYNPVRKVVNKYQYGFGDPLIYPNGHNVRGLAIGLFIPGVINQLGACTIYPCPRSPQFVVTEYHLDSPWFYPVSKIQTDYDPADSTKQLITTENYHYDNAAHIELTREEVSKSNGDNYNVLLRYPKDINPAFAFNSSPVIEKRLMVNNGSSVINGSITTYKNQPGEFPDAYYTLKTPQPVDPAGLAFYDGTGVDPVKYESRFNYSYDDATNIATVLKEGLIADTYLWGYHHQYPVASVKNASYQDLVNVLGQGVINQLNNTPGTDAQIRSQLAVLRTALPNAQVTTYTYSPLVGMTSMTDAKGITTYYEYDGFMRLMNIKDKDGNIIKHIDYHYQNQ